MSERMVLVVEAFGHWALAWTLVVLAVAVWIARPATAPGAVRYGGWLLATFAGRRSGADRPRGGTAWPPGARCSAPSRPAVGRPSVGGPPSAFRSWFDGDADDRSARNRSATGRTIARRRGARGADSDRSAHGAAGRRVDSPDLRSDRWLLLAAGIWAAGFLSSPRGWSGRPAHPGPAGRGRADGPAGARIRAGAAFAASWGSVAGCGSPCIPRSPRRCASDCSGRSSSGRRPRTAR